MARPIFGVDAPVRKRSAFRGAAVSHSTLEREQAAAEARASASRARRAALKETKDKPCCPTCRGTGGACLVCGHRLHDGQARGWCGVCYYLALKGRDPQNGLVLYDGRFGPPGGVALPAPADLAAYMAQVAELHAGTPLEPAPASPPRRGDLTPLGQPKVVATAPLLRESAA